MTFDAVPECRKTDAVLALHLDGDVGGPLNADDSGFEFVCVESLHTHLLECPSCQRQLQRARRLDAVLASGTGRQFAASADLPALERRWFASIEPVAATAMRAPALQRTGRSALAIAVAIAVSIAVVAFTIFGFVRRESPPPAGAPSIGTPVASPADESEPTPAAITAPATLAPAAVTAEPEEILIAGDAVRRQSERERTTARPVATSRASLLASLRRECEASSVAPTDRLAALRELSLMTRSSGTDGDAACDEMIDLLTAMEDRSPAQHVVLVDMWNVARSEPRFVGNVQRRLARLDTQKTTGTPELADLAAMTVAARLGVRAVDAVVVRALRRHPALGEPLAAALRSGVRPNGTAALLLDAWHALAIRGAAGDDDLAAQSWFAGQTATTFDELVNELRSSGSSPRRVQCSLALGFCPDGRVVPVLLDRIRRAPQVEAWAAAFALSRLPRGHLLPLVERAAQDDDAFLLRAALARAAVDGTEPWIVAAQLRDDEWTSLCGGTFHDFTAIAPRFRDRPMVATAARN